MGRKIKRFKNRQKYYFNENRYVFWSWWRFRTFGRTLPRALQSSSLTGIDIGLLFELVANADGLGNGAEQDEHGIFHAYSRKLKVSGATSKEWLRIKQTFMMLEEWFEDRTLCRVR